MKQYCLVDVFVNKKTFVVALTTLLLAFMLFLCSCGADDDSGNKNDYYAADESMEKASESVDSGDITEEQVTADSEIADEEQLDIVMWDENWEYFHATTGADYLGLMPLLNMKKTLGTHTCNLNLMKRGNYESVEENSMESWITHISDVSDNSFSKRIMQILTDKDYFYLNDVEKAFIDYYIRYSLFDIEQYVGVNHRDIGYLEEIWLLNDEGNEYFDLSFKNPDGTKIHAPKELVMKFSGVDSWESVLFFDDFNNADNHCIYRHTIEDKYWRIVDDGEYVVGNFTGYNSMKSQNDALKEENLKHGSFYIREDGSVVWAKKLDIQEFNQLIDEYSDFYNLMKQYSGEIYKPYFDNLEAQSAKEHEEKQEQKKEEREQEAQRRKTVPKVNMTKLEVLQTGWGEPNKKNITEYEWGTYEQWVYTHKGYVYFENGIVTAVQKIE